jgi:hypothetical protein
MIDELLFTLRIARESLPSEAHRVNAVRLFLIEHIVRRALEQEPEYWRNLMADADKIADDAALRRLEGDKSHD